MTRQPLTTLTFAVTLAATVALASTARAQDAPDDHGVGALEVDRLAAGSLFLGGGVVYVLSEFVFKDELAPGACRWCGSNALDDGVRDALVWADVERARSAANLTGFVAAPVVGFGLVAALGWQGGASGEQILDDQLIIAEAVISAVLLNQGVKLLVGRERPFVHHRPAGTAAPGDGDDHLSFYSGHTSLTFSLAVAGGTVASLRGYPGAPWVWGAGLALGVSTGWLRIAGDKHYFTDVVTGAVIGSVIGFAMPYFLHRPAKGGAAAQDAHVSAGWSGGGPMLGWSGRF